MTRRHLLVLALTLGATRAEAQSRDLATTCLAAMIPSAAGTPADFAKRTAQWRVDTARVSADLPALIDALNTEFGTHATSLTPAQTHTIQSRIARLADMVSGPSPDFDLIPQASSPDDNGSYVLFSGTPDSIIVDTAMPLAARQAVCYTALEAQDVITNFRLPARKALLAKLQQRVDRWNNFHDHGYSQFVLELVANSWFGFPREPLEPPANQWILLHPSVSVEVPTPFKLGVDGKDAMVMEWLGVVHYFADEKNFTGLALASVFGQGEKLGIGIVAHYGSLGHVGWMYRPASAAANSSRNTLVIAADLLKAVNAMPGAWSDAAKKVQQQLVSCIAHLSCTP